MALGLGDIHVESALNQPLAAQIEIVGGTAESAAGLTATIADSETFQRYGLERPASLASTALTVRKDGQGRTVLFLRSTDAFTEPMVTLLVDLHSANGELIREYTVMLDPPGLAQEQAAVSSASARQSPELDSAAGSASVSGSGSGSGSAQASVPASASPSASASSSEPAPASMPTSASPSASRAELKDSAVALAAAEQTAGPAAKPATDTYTVARHETLDRIAGIAGARTRSDRHKMMIAIFRANPSAFRTNFNSLRRGVTLHLPSVADLSKIPADEANQEFATQMAGWRSPEHRSSLAMSSSATTSPAASPAAARSATNNAAAVAKSSASAIAAEEADIEAHEAETVALTQRIASLEKSLDEERQKLRQSPVASVASVAPVASVAKQRPFDYQPVEQPAVVSKSVPAAASSVPPTASSAPAAATTAATSASATATSATAAPTPATEQFADTSATDEEDNPAPRRRNWLVTLALRVGAVFAVGIALALAVIAGVWLYRRRRSDDDSFSERDFAREESARLDSDSNRSAETDDTSLPFAKVDISASYLVEELKHEAEQAHAGADGEAVARSTSASVSAGVSPSTDADEIESTFVLDTAAIDATEALESLESSDPTSHPEFANDSRSNSAPASEPTVKLAIEPTVKLPTPRNSSETTALLALHPELTLDDTAAREFAFFNPESALNTTHVTIAGDAGDPKPFVERRKNPADVLRQAIEREPERSDLRLKLLELYYTAAAQNRRAFLEGVRQLAKNDKLAASASDWSQIEDMGRAIAPDDELFSNGLGDDKKAVA